MIAWFGPAMLVLLLSAAQPTRADAGPGVVAVTLAEEFAAVSRCPVAVRVETELADDDGFTAAPVRVLPRCRSVTEAGLPAPRAP